MKYNRTLARSRIMKIGPVGSVFYKTINPLMSTVHKKVIYT